MRRVLVLLFVTVLATSASVASAQGIARPQRSSIDGIEIVTGFMDYDLSGTGSTVPYAIRGTKALTSHLSLELGSTFAHPEQQLGRSRFVAPEARLTYSWGRGRWRPFLSGGGGFAVTASDAVDTRWRSTLLAGGGTRVQLSDRMYAVGEMRLRGLSNFTGTTAEWLGGIGWEIR